MTREEREARVWQALRALVLERYDHRREAAESLGISYLRVKALRSVAAGALTMHDLAAALATDASYTTIMVDDLEERGLLTRTAHPGDRRVKIVSATGAGRRLAKRADRILGLPPQPMRAMTEDDLATLERIVLVMAGGTPPG